MILVSATFFDKLIAALWAAAEFMVFPVGALVLGFFLLSRLVPQLKETWNAAKAKHPLRVILIAICVVTAFVYAVGEIGLSYTEKRFQKEYACIDVPDEEIGQIEIQIYDRENKEFEEYVLTDSQERKEFLSVLRQIQYMGWTTRKGYEIGRYSYTVSVYQTEDSTQSGSIYFKFSAKDSHRPTDNFFYIAIGNAEPVVTYMENLFGVSE